MDSSESKRPENVLRIIFHVLRRYPGHGFNQRTSKLDGVGCGAHRDLISRHYIFGKKVK